MGIFMWRWLSERNGWCFAFKRCGELLNFSNTLWPEKREGGRVILARKWCVLSCQNRHIFGFINQKFYTSTMTESKENAAKTRCQNKFVIHLLREPGSGLVTIMQSSAVQFSAYMGHGTHPKYRLHFCGWVTYTFFSCVFLNCQLSWLISTLSHVLELRNDILWIKCWDFSPFLHCKCIIWCLGWWDGINWYQQKVLLIRIHS